jgi:effector-binding domain-containing protein
VVGVLTYDVQLVESKTQPVAVVHGRHVVRELPAFLAGAFMEILEALRAQHLFPTGPPFGRYAPTPEGFDAEAGFPSSGEVQETGRVEPSTLPGGLVAQVEHVGPYDGISAAYEAVEQWLDEHGYVVTGAPWESYPSGPDTPEPRTLVCFPCRPA